MGRKINVIPIFVFLVVALIIYYPILLGEIPFNGNLLVGLWPPLNFFKWTEFPAGIPFKFMGVDEVREFYPLLDFTYNSFRSGQIPLWNPYNFSGYSHIGNWASGVFYPLHLSILILNKPFVLILLKLSASVLAGFFTYLYLKALKLSEISSYFGAFAFALSATMQIWDAEIWQSAHAFLWFPLALFSIEKIIREGKMQFVLLLGFSIAMSIMAGYIQPTIYLLLISLIYFIFRILIEKKKELKIVFKVFFGFVLGFGVSAVQLVPAIEAYLLSPRSQVQLHDLNVSFLLPLTNIVTLFVPDFFGNIVTQNWFITRPGQYYENMIYVGIIPLVLAGLSFWIKKYRSLVIFFAAATLISLSLTFNLPTSRLVYDLSVPFLSSSIPIRVIFVTSFAISVLSAIGIEWWLNEKNKKKTFLALIPIVSIFVIVGSFVVYSILNNLKISALPDKWYIISARNLVIPSFFTASSMAILVVGQFLLKKRKNLGFVLIAFLVLSSFLFINKYISFSDNKFLYPTHPLIDFVKDNQGFYRYWGYGSANLPNNFATVYKIYSPEGYDPVNIAYYNELLSSGRKGKYEGAFSRSDALIYAVTEFPFEDVNDPRYRIMDMLGVKYIGFEKGEISKIEERRLDPLRFKKVWDKDNFIVFENRKVFPRVYFADRFVLRIDKRVALEEIYDKNIDLRTTVISSEALPVKENEIQASARIISYEPNKVIVEAETAEPKILILSDSFYPGWKANINNVETKIYRVNYALRGVVVPSGRSRIIFYYLPPSFHAGILITGVSLLIAGFIYLRKRNVN